MSVDASAGAAAVIELRGVSKHYDNGAGMLQALKAIDFTVRANDYVALVGASGSGKSTLMNILGCLDRPSEGRMHFNGTPTQDMGDTELSRLRNRHIGFVFQSYSLLPKLSALENVAQPLVFAGVGQGKRREMAARMLEKVGLADRARHYPNQLSGGQQQRVAIARALVNTPSVVLADEPTGNLDSASSRVIMDLFASLHGEGQTIVMVTHDASVAAQCRSQVEIRDGEFVR